MHFTALLTAALAASAATALTIVDVTADVKTIAGLVKNLNTSIQKANGKNLAASLAINDQVEFLVTQINHATVDTNTLVKKASAKQAQAIIDDLTKAEKAAKAASKKLIADKANYVKTGVRAVVEGDLKSLGSAVKGFGKALLKQTPASAKADAQDLLDAFNADIAAAEKAYKAPKKD